MIGNIDEKMSAFGYLAVATVMLYILVVTAPVYVGLKAVAGILRKKETQKESPETRRSTVS